MTIYTKNISSPNKSSNYRRIYEKHYGPIPKDSEGRVYDVHHLDGDHTNNDISNLVAVSIQDHYNIHLLQKDYHAAHAVAIRMTSPPDTLSDLAKIVQQELVDNGKHIFQQADGPTKLIWTCEHCNKTGRGASNYVKWHGDNCLVLNPNRSCKKTGPKKKKACEHCGVLAAPNTFVQYHGDKCKLKTKQ